MCEECGKEDKSRAGWSVQNSPCGPRLVGVFKSTVKRAGGGAGGGRDGWSSSPLLWLGTVRQTAQLPKSAQFLNVLWRHFPNRSSWHSSGGNSSFSRQSLNPFRFLFVKWPNLILPPVRRASVLNFFCIRISPTFARSSFQDPYPDLLKTSIQGGAQRTLTLKQHPWWFSAHSLGGEAATSGHLWFSLDRKKGGPSWPDQLGPSTLPLPINIYHQMWIQKQSWDSWTLFLLSP